MQNLKLRFLLCLRPLTTTENETERKTKVWSVRNGSGKRREAKGWTYAVRKGSQVMLCNSLLIHARTQPSYRCELTRVTVVCFYGGSKEINTPGPLLSPGSGLVPPGSRLVPPPRSGLVPGRP